MPSVCFFHYFPFQGGAETVTLRLLSRLRQHMRPLALVPDGELARAYQAQGFAVEVLRLLPRGGPGCWWNPLAHAVNLLISLAYLARARQRHQVQAIVAVTFMAAVYALPAALLLNIPLVWHNHDILPRRLRYFVRALVARCQGVIAVSEAVRRNLRDLGADTEPVVVIHNGVDTDAWHPRAHDVAEARRRLDLHPRAEVVSLICQMAAWKGVEDFVAAAARLHEERPNAVFLLAGAAYERGDRFVGLLHQRAANLDPRGTYLRLLHRVPNVADLIAASDVVVQPSRQPDPLPTVILEAMAMARPVIGTWLGGIPEMIEPGVNGLLVPGGDVEALAAAIREALSSAEVRAAWGEAGRRIVLERFRLEDAAARTMAVLEAVARA